jgi:hypothetical protein
MLVRLEHANLCVRDIPAMIRFLQTAFPDFRQRGEGTSQDGTRWVHLGTDETYIALGQSSVNSGNIGLPTREFPASTISPTKWTTSMLFACE